MKKILLGLTLSTSLLMASNSVFANANALTKVSQAIAKHFMNTNTATFADDFTRFMNAKSIKLGVKRTQRSQLGETHIEYSLMSVKKDELFDLSIRSYKYSRTTATELDNLVVIITNKTKDNVTFSVDELTAMFQKMGLDENAHFVFQQVSNKENGYVTKVLLKNDQDKIASAMSDILQRGDHFMRNLTMP